MFRQTNDVLTSRGEQLSYSASDPTLVRLRTASLSAKRAPEPSYPSTANGSPPTKPSIASGLDSTPKLTPADLQNSSLPTSTASASSLHTDDAPRSAKLPFDGLVFGVIPTDWDEDVLLQAQRIIVVGTYAASD